MLYTVNDLKSALGGGAKVDKFTIEFGTTTGPVSLALGTDYPILCKATSFGTKTIATMEVFVQGRKLKLPGDTEFPEEQSFTFYQTGDHKLRKLFIDWMNAIDDFGTNVHTCDPLGYMVEAKVMQLDCDGVATATYTFYNMWPTRIDNVEVNGETINTVQEFVVTFNYSHWELTTK